MAVMEVWINDESVALAGGDDFNILTLGIMSPTDVAPATVQLTGWRKSTSEHFQWFYTRLKSDDRVRAVLRKSGIGLEPSNTWSYSREDSARTSAQAVAMENKGVAAEPLPCTFSLSQGRQSVRATADHESMLQASATWHQSHNHLKVELGCVATENSNQNRFWIESHVEFDEPIEIAVRY